MSVGLIAASVATLNLPNNTRPARSTLLVFGNTAVGSTNGGAMTVNAKRGSTFSSGTISGQLTDVVAYLDGLGGTSGSEQVIAAVYNDASGALVSSSAAKTINAGQAGAWVDFPLSSGLVAAGTKYRLALLSGGSAIADYRGNSGGVWNMNSDTFSDGPSNPFGTSSNTGTLSMSIYAQVIPLFGKASVGASNGGAMTVDAKRGSTYSSAAVAGTLANVYAYVDGLAATTGSESLLAAVYNDSTGALVASSASQTVTAGQKGAWLRFPLSGTIAASTNYRLALLTGGAAVAEFRYDTGGAWNMNLDTFSDGPSNPFGASKYTATYAMSIYATVVPAPTPTPTPTATATPTATPSATPTPTPTPTPTATPTPTPTPTATPTPLPTSPTFASETAYTLTRPAFTPTREIDVTSGSALKTAIANIQPGDLIKATADFTLSTASGDALDIRARPSSTAVIDLSQHVVKFVYTGTSEDNAVAILNAANLRIYGGDLSSGQGGACLLWFSSQHVTWWGLKAHDCGADGLSMFTGSSGYSYTGAVQNNDIEAEIWHTGLHPAWDNHTEKCTGIHGANLADSNYFDFSGNRIALNVHDEACSGGGIEFGSAFSSPLPHDNTIILECTHFTFISTIQTGGNCYQAWGYGMLNIDIKYLSATDLTGHAYYAGGLYNKSGVGQTYLTTDVVEYGRASNTNQNSKYANDPIWDKTGGTVFKDVLPTP